MWCYRIYNLNDCRMKEVVSSVILSYDSEYVPVVSVTILTYLNILSISFYSVNSYIFLC